MAEKNVPEARLHAIVHGRVQGVGFRYHTTHAAQELGVTGWVANRWDGTVETVAEGSKEDLDKFVSFLHQGPSSAMVLRVESEWLAPNGEFNNFRVHYTL